MGKLDLAFLKVLQNFDYRSYKFKSPLPSVTCTCITYGRWNRMRYALACFLLQDYPGSRRLHILNDAKKPLVLSAKNPSELSFEDGRVVIQLVNAPHFPNLGSKRQKIVDEVTTQFTAHWEDDDLYLPWHLLYMISVLDNFREHECAKPYRGWRMEGDYGKLDKCYYANGKHDGGMVFRAGTSVPYVDGTRSIPLSLIDDYVKRGKMLLWIPKPDWISYVFRLSDGVRHLSKSGTRHARARKNWERTNRDFGDGKPLLPSENVIEWAKDVLRESFLFIASKARDKGLASLANTISLSVKEL